MHNILTVARYHLLRALKDRVTFFIGLLMPAVMMFVLGTSMSENEATVTLDIIDQDNSPLSQQMVALLRDEMTASSGEGNSGFRLCEYSDPGDGCNLDDDLPDRADDWLSTAEDRLETADSFGALILQAGFGASLSAGDTAAILFKNNTELSAPTLAEQKINAAISRLGSAVTIANLTVTAAADEFGGLEPGTPERAAAFDQVRAEVEAAWADRPVQVRAVATQDEGMSNNGFNQSGPGIASMFVLMFMLNISTLLLTERENGTLARLYSLPVPRSHILGGILLGHYVYGLLQFLVLIVVGSMMGVEWGGDPLGIALIVLLFTFTATALGLALGTVVRTSAQAENMSTLLGLTLSPLGGAWWPLEIVPDFMKTIGHLTPVAWTMDAFQELMWYDGTTVDILPMLGVLLAMGLALFAFGVWRFRYE